METEIKEQKQKKKILGIPAVLFGILCVFGVLAVVTVVFIASHVDFTKNINVFGFGGHDGTQKVSVQITGDVGSTTVNCEDGVCSSGDIFLTNQDSNPHTCTVSTTSDLEVTYTDSVVDGAVSLEGGQSKTFKINYIGSSNGDYSAHTSIDCN